MLLSFLGPSVSIGPIKVSLQGIDLRTLAVMVLLHYKTQYQLVIFSKNADFIFLNTFVCLVDISWSQFALWPFLFSYISDHLPIRLLGTHPFNILDFTFCFFLTFYIGQYLPCDFKCM